MVAGWAVGCVPGRARRCFVPGGGCGERSRAQLYVMPTFGGEAEALTDAKGGVTAFQWSPDSKCIAYVAQVPLSGAEEKKQKDKDDARVVDRDYRYSHLW